MSTYGIVAHIVKKMFIIKKKTILNSDSDYRRLQSEKYYKYILKHLTC